MFVLFVLGLIGVVFGIKGFLDGSMNGETSFISFVGGAILIASVVISKMPHKAHRIKEHAYARLLWKKTPAGVPYTNQIEINNLDSGNVAQMHSDSNLHWSSLCGRTNKGSGKWVWEFAAMGISQYDPTDSVHIGYMYDAEDRINSYLEQIINPIKDRSS